MTRPISILIAITLSLLAGLTSTSAFGQTSDEPATPVMLARSAAAQPSGQPAEMGATGGGIQTTRTVDAFTTNSYTIHFLGGRLAEVVVIGDGDTDLDVYVYDENGHLIAQDLGMTDNCYVSWTPRWSGTFTVKVRNRGGVYNRFLLLTN